MTHPRKKSFKTDVPLIEYDRKNSSVLHWNIGGGLMITRNLNEDDVVLEREGQSSVVATFTSREALEVGIRLYRQGVRANDDNLKRHAQALVSASVLGN